MFSIVRKYLDELLANAELELSRAQRQSYAVNLLPYIKEVEKIKKMIAIDEEYQKIKD